MLFRVSIDYPTYPPTVNESTRGSFCPIGTPPDRGREATDRFGKGHALSFAIFCCGWSDAGDAECFPSAAGG